MLADLASLGWTATTVYVAAYRETQSSLFFSGRAVPIQAGRMLQVNVSDLGP